MKNIEQKIADFDWQTVTGDINEKKYTLWCQDSYLVCFAMNSFANTITQIYIARPVQLKDILLD
jgi:hypothetical protein